MNRKLREVLVLVAACLAFVWCVPSYGQVLKGAIQGAIVDQQGAVVSGAQVKATEISTGVVRTTTTDSSGLFRFNLIPVGSYKVEVSAKGFKTAVQNNVLVDAGRDTGLGSLKLTVGEASTTVEVSAEAPLIETTQAQVSNTFSGETLSTFAGVQENQGLDNLAVFVPGVSSVRDNGFSNSNGGGGFSSNGQRGRNNDQQIDGQNNNDNSVGGPGVFVSDAEFVQQYVLITNQFGPEYGRNAGAVVNIITKSGGNAWHGSVYGTENNSALNSLNNSNKNTDICGSNCLTKPPRLNDEFAGATIGGPLMKNKAFIFGGWDEERISRKSVFTSSGITPTPAGLTALAACFPTAGTPSNDAVLAAAGFSAFAISGGNPIEVGGSEVTGVVGACTNAAFSQVQRTVSRPINNDDFVIKTDLQFGSDSITGRYIYNSNKFFAGNDNGAAGYFVDVPALSQAALISWTRNLSSHAVNEARVSYGRLNVEFGGNAFNSEPPAAQLLEAPTSVIFQLSGNLGFGANPVFPQQRIVNTWQGQDNFNYVMGKHQLKAGVNWTYQRTPNIFLPNINGQYRFRNWDAFFNNTPNRVRIANGPSGLDFREYDTFAYGGDDWKVGKNLSVQFGLTWSYYGQPANLFNDITVPRESNAATAFWDPTLPLSIRTLPTIPAPKNSFGPSVGFTWTPQWGGLLTGNGKTTFRGGYRMLYDPPFYNIYLNIATSAPEVFLQTLTGGALTGVTLPAVPTGPNVRASLAGNLTLGVFDPRTFAETNITPNFGPDKVQSWSLGFERELSKNAVLEARYAGNHSYNLFQTLDGNPFIADLAADFPQLVPAGVTPCPAGQEFSPVAAGRVNCNEGIMRTRGNTGFSNYQSAQVEFRAQNLFKQLTVRSSYTYSKTLDNVSEIFSTFGGGNTVFFAQNPANQINGPGEYSFSGLDFPHQWSILFTENLPFFKEQHGIAGKIMGGWSIAANYLVASGQRYSPVQFGDALFTANGDYYDFGYVANFAGIDTAHPFLGNLGAPAKSVGIYTGDACDFFGVCIDPSGQPVSTLNGNRQILETMDSVNNAATPVATTSDQVRFIINAGTSQAIFGTPFGNSPRNPVQDARTNIGNVSIYKNVKINERINFQFHTTWLNAFNHPNFSSVDPFVEDSGLHGSFNGFGDPTQTPSTTRNIFFGGKITF